MPPVSYISYIFENFSSLSRPLKLRLFAATVESVFLYGCEAWTITPKLAKEIDGCYTRMLRAVLNVHWRQHITNKELYGELPKLSDKIRQRRLRFAGHCSRSQQEPVSKLLHWTPKHGRRKPGRPALNYSDIPKQETGMESTELMQDCNEGQEDLESHDSSRTPLDISQVK